MNNPSRLIPDRTIVNKKPAPSDSMAPGEVNPDVACDGCGVFGAVAVGDGWLCERCYAEKGSCCPEFGKDDLWQDRCVEPNQKPLG